MAAALRRVTQPGFPFRKTKTMRNVSFPATAFILATLSGCGGGGGMNSTPTPVPSPTPTPGQRNTNLTNLQFSESFANRGASLSAANVANGTASNITGSTGAMTIQYDASSRSYTVSSNGRSETFSPSDIDPVNSSAILDNYKRGDNNLILFKPGTSAGGLNLTYASYGAWQQSDRNTSSLDIRQTFFVYGVPTQASDLPRTGTATYTALVDGFWATSGGVYSLTGTGNLSANFSNNQLTASMNLTGQAIPNLSSSNQVLGSVSSTATINPNDASFSGTLSGSGYTGTLNGMFFGPQAAEAGGAFSIRNGAGSTANGVIIGKKN